MLIALCLLVQNVFSQLFMRQMQFAKLTKANNNCYKENKSTVAKDCMTGTLYVHMAVISI